MFTIKSLAKGYNTARNQNKHDDKNFMGNMLIMQIMENPSEVLAIEDLSEIGTALFSIFYDSQGSVYEKTHNYQLGLMICFYSLYKSYLKNPNDDKTKLNLNIICKTNVEIIMQWFKIGAIIKYNITEPITKNSKNYFLYEKTDILIQLLTKGIIDYNEDYIEYCEIINIGISKILYKNNVK